MLGGKSKEGTPRAKGEEDALENETDSEYEDSEEDQFEAPPKDASNEAIFNKFVNKGPHKESIIYEEDESLENGVEPHFRFKIKNLDTGEEEEIENEEQESNLQKKMSNGRQQIAGVNASWEGFWKNVQRNNERLRICCETGAVEEVRTLILRGDNNYPAEINCKGLDQWTPLHYACYEGQAGVTQLLLQSGANVNAVTKFGRTALHIATLKGHIQCVKILCKYKIEWDNGDTEGNTALHFAAEAGHREIIQFLLSIGCAIKKNKENLTPIDDCCDESVKKIFYEGGFKEDGVYEAFRQPKSNRLQRELIKTNTLSTEDFIFHKMLGKGSFGQVFLVRLKGADKKLYAMKVLSKQKIMTKSLKRYALTERNVMSVINHPFMVKLSFAFQSSTKLFLVMDYYPGGDLGKLVSRRKAIPEEEAKKYICELILAFEALHKNMIVFRDLKPDNVVLDSEGHVRLTDFGLSKEGIYNNTTESFCGSVAYLAPQILFKQGHSRTVDWYLLGLLLYELIVGLPPYYNTKKEVLFENIKRGPLKIPKTMSPEAKDLIKKLLCRDPRKRLGAQKDSEELKEHDFFKGVDWKEVFARKLIMTPIQEPKVNLNDTIKVDFGDSEVGKKLQNWTFIGQIEQHRS